MVETLRQGIRSYRSLGGLWFGISRGVLEGTLMQFDSRRIKETVPELLAQCRDSTDLWMIVLSWISLCWMLIIPGQISKQVSCVVGWTDSYSLTNGKHYLAHPLNLFFPGWPRITPRFCSIMLISGGDHHHSSLKTCSWAIRIFSKEIVNGGPILKWIDGVGFNLWRNCKTSKGN